MSGKKKEKKMLFRPIDYALIEKHTRDSLRNYVRRNNLQALVLGVSGGIDSALCAALAHPVCVELNIPLIGRSIPIDTNEKDEVDRANNIGETFCTDFHTYDLTHPFIDLWKGLVITEMEEDELLADEFDNLIEVKIRKGNLKARLRMVYLYDLAQANNGMVLSTDNLTEYLLGFWTLHGDVGDYGMVQKLWKTEVYALAKCLRRTLENKKYTAFQKCIEATPTDGLGITISDLDQLGVDSYDEADRILKTWLCDDQDAFCWDEYLYFEGRTEDYEELVAQREALKDHPIVQRHLRSAYKRKNPFNISRSNLISCRILTAKNVG